jgi:DNA replication protein DnaC
MNRGTMSRESHRSFVRSDAIRELDSERPGWTRLSTYWGCMCETCGEERPSQPVHGCVCACERVKVAAIVADVMEREGPAVARAILEHAGIPVRHGASRFDTFQAVPGTADALAAVREWADAFTLETREGLLLAGPFGSGKSHLAVSALRHVIESALVEGRFVSAGDLVSAVRSGAHITWKPVDDAIGAELLVLDDLGQESGSDFTRDIIARVVFGRYDAARPTIFTSNLGTKGMTDALGGAVTSRLHEMTRPVTWIAKDYRLLRVSA